VCNGNEFSQQKKIETERTEVVTTVEDSCQGKRRALGVEGSSDKGGGEVFQLDLVTMSWDRPLQSSRVTL